MPRDIGEPIKSRNPGVIVDIQQNKSHQIPLRIRTKGGTTLFQVDADGAAQLAAGSVGSAELNETLVRYQETTILAAAVATLRGSPVTVVTAPGAGKMIEIVGGEVFLDYGGVAYTESTDNLVLRYTDGSGTTCSEVIEMTGFITLTADASTSIRAKLDSIVTAAVAVNAPVVIHNNGDGEFGNSGTSDLRIKVAYRVHTTGF